MLQIEGWKPHFNFHLSSERAVAAKVAKVDKALQDRVITPEQHKEIRKFIGIHSRAELTANKPVIRVSNTYLEGFEKLTGLNLTTDE